MPKWFGGSALNPDDIIAPEEQWRMQWDRVKRWYLRCRRISDKASKNGMSLEEVDDVISFFQNCYHLRDWIQASRPDLTTDLETLFSNNAEMGFCRDICNGFKHKSLTRPSFDPEFNLYREKDWLAVSAGEKGSAVRYRVAFQVGTDIVKYDLFEVVENCFELWKYFVKGVS